LEGNKSYFDVCNCGLSSKRARV